MDAFRAVGSRHFARAGVIASSLAILAIVAVPNGAAAATQIGSPLGNFGPCGVGIDTVQTASAGATYAVPAGGGSITAWTTRAGTDAGPLGLQVWRPTLTAATYTLVGASPLMTLTPNILNTFALAAPITVLAGDLLGLRLQGPAECLQTTSAPDTFGYSVVPTPAIGSAVVMTNNSGFTLNVAATLGSAAPTGDQQGDHGDHLGSDQAHSTDGSDQAHSTDGSDQAHSTDGSDQAHSTDGADRLKNE